MDKDIADFALNYAAGKKVEYAEVRAHKEKAEGLIMRNGVLDAYVSTVDDGFCIRVLAEGGIGFASTNKWTKEETKKIVEIAFAFAKMAKRKDKIVFAEEKSIKANWKVNEKKGIENVSPETRIETFLEMDRELTSRGINVASRMFSFGTSLTEKYFVNTEGSAISSFVPRVGAYGFITVVENGKPEQAYKQFGYAGGWEALDEWKLTEQMINQAKVLQRVIKEAKAVKPGKMDLLCGSEVAGIAAHESCGHPMEADRILGREMSQAGESFVYPGARSGLEQKSGATRSRLWTTQPSKTVTVTTSTMMKASGQDPDTCTKTALSTSFYTTEKPRLN